MRKRFGRVRVVLHDGTGGEDDSARGTIARPGEVGLTEVFKPFNDFGGG